MSREIELKFVIVGVDFSDDIFDIPLSSQTYQEALYEAKDYLLNYRCFPIDDVKKYMLQIKSIEEICKECSISIDDISIQTEGVIDEKGILNYNY